VARGSWAKRSTPSLGVPLKPGLDPEHGTASPRLDVPVGNPLWHESTAAPMLPDHLVDGAPAAPEHTGTGPLDTSPDYGHELGVAPGHGQTQRQQLATGQEIHSMDFGAPAANTWVPMINRDGTNHVAIIPDGDNDGESPQTVALQRSGLGIPNDPYARRGKRIKRWYDRFIDMHDWSVERRPVYVRNAYQDSGQPAVAGGTQYDSPYGTLQQVSTQDSFVAPQVRRTPGPWDEPLSSDGSGQLGVSAGYGLTSWGL
jgi:hypothetical protein